jgi:hypothetical protein
VSAGSEPSGWRVAAVGAVVALSCIAYRLSHAPVVQPASYISSSLSSSPRACAARAAAGTASQPRPRPRRLSLGARPAAWVRRRSSPRRPGRRSRGRRCALKCFRCQRRRRRARRGSACTMRASQARATAQRGCRTAVGRWQPPADARRGSVALRGAHARRAGAEAACHLRAARLKIEGQPERVVRALRRRSGKLGRAMRGSP